MLINGAGLWLGTTYVAAAALYDPDLLAGILNAQANGASSMVLANMAVHYIRDKAPQA